MTTNPIRFLLVQESLKDRTLFSLLRQEGHEVGFLVPGNANLAQHPLPEGTPIMTTPQMAEDFNPAVYLFPRPYVGKYAGEMIRNKKYVIGSSQAHHAMASIDRGYSEAILKNAGLPFKPSLYAASAAEFHHYINFLDAKKRREGVKYRFCPAPFVDVDCDTPEELAHLARVMGVDSNCTIMEYDFYEPGLMLRTVCFVSSGKQVLPPSFHVSVGKGTLRMTSAPEVGAVKEIRRKLESSLVAIRYVGPIFVSYVCGPEGDLDMVTTLTSEVPAGFWPAFYYATDYRDGLGKALLHMGRHSLKNCPLAIDPAYVQVERCTVSSEHFETFFPIPEETPILPEYTIDNGFIPEDVLSKTIVGPQLGWVATELPNRRARLSAHYLDHCSYGRQQVQAVVESAMKTCYPDGNNPSPENFSTEDVRDDQVSQGALDGGNAPILSNGSTGDEVPSGDPGGHECDESSGSEAGPSTTRTCSTPDRSSVSGQLDNSESEA